MLCSLCDSDRHFIRDCSPEASRNFVRANLRRGIPAVHICHDLLNCIEEVNDRHPDVNHEDASKTSEAIDDSKDSPSELHLFDQISTLTEQPETQEKEDMQTRFFDKLDENIATNFISAKFLQTEYVPAPQVLFHPGDEVSDFLQDVQCQRRTVDVLRNGSVHTEQLSPGARNMKTS